MMNLYIFSDKRGTTQTLLCQGLAAGQWFSPGTPISSTNKLNRHDLAEILLKVALNTITITLTPTHIKRTI
jgi:hypothetical protein